jgi:hypothetical protein
MDGSEPPSWTVTDEFAARLGCGTLTALALPLWFALTLVALAESLSDLALWLAVALTAVSCVGGVVAWVKIRSVPRRITVRDGMLELDRPAGLRRVPLAEIRRVRIGPDGLLRGVHIELAGNREIRLSSGVGDFEGLVGALRRSNDEVIVVDESRGPTRGGRHG